MKKLTRPIVLATLIMFTLVVGLASLSLAGDESAGKTLFLGKKCNLCHSVESQGITKKSEKMKGAELSDVGNRLSDAAWLKGFMLQSELKDGEKHKKKWNGTDEELDAMVTWVLSLKKS
jgi:cytochrome c2